MENLHQRQRRRYDRLHDLTVENHACYQANGFLVSNSDSFRYMSLAWREIAPDASPKPPPRDSWDAAFQSGSDTEELRDCGGWRENEAAF